MSYWRRMGITEDPGFFPLGSKAYWDVLKMKLAFSRLTNDAYFEHPGERMIGAYSTFGTPVLVVRDLELAKCILVKDFDHFVDRQHPSRDVIGPNTKNNKYLAKMLTNLRAEEWKHMRSSLSPVFTSRKLKTMVPLIQKIANECNEHLENICGEDINGKELMRDFALDVIVSTAFGIESNTFKEPDNIFKKYSKLMIGETVSWKFTLTLILFFACPWVLKWLDMPLFDKTSTEFFANLIKTSMKERKKDCILRNDLIDLIIDVIEKETAEYEAEVEAEEEFAQYDLDAILTKEEEKLHRWTKNELEVALISNSLLTFIVAFDQVSNASCLMLLNLANNPDIRERLYQEISHATNECNSENLDYSIVMKLSYLDMIFQETLRYYPIAHLERVSTKDYKIPDTDIIIPSGMLVRIATPAIMKDEQYYSEPERFNPENFNEETKTKRSPYAYSGFGHGPRNCIAMRFAIMQVKVAVSSVLAKYRILPCQKSITTLVADPKSRSGLPKGGVWFTVEKRSSKNI